MKKHNTESYKNFKIIDNFKDKDPLVIAKYFLKFLTYKQREEFLEIAGNEEIRNGIFVFFRFLIENFRGKNVEDFIVNLQNNIEKHMSEIPQDYDIEKYLPLFKFFEKIVNNSESLQLNIVDRKTILDDFDIDTDTLSEWLVYFEKEKYLEKRSFTSNEYSSIIKDFVNPFGETTVEIDRFHFRTYNKKIISEILGDTTRSEKTNYNNLIIKTGNIDDLKNEKLLHWIKKHNKMPFSIAYNWISLINKTLPEDERLEVSEMFFEYFKNKKSDQR